MTASSRGSGRWSCPRRSATCRLPRIAVLDEIRRQLQLAGRPAAMPLVQLIGPDAMSKQAVACSAAGLVGFELYRLAAEELPAQHGELETLSLLWRRECRLRARALFLDADDIDPARSVEGTPHPIARFLSGSTGWIILSASQLWPRLGRPSVALDVAKPTPVEQRELWAAELSGDAGDNPALLAGQFNLNMPTILAIVGRVRAEGIYTRRALRHRLWADCRDAVRPRFDTFAQRLEPKATLRDLVLPADAKRLLRLIVSQVRYRDRVYEDWGFARRMSRGLGLSVLFSGESGTGKTMAAEALANRLRLDLFRIDLSAVVSKYIGETEKNLRKVFDAAEDGGAILFFDEADALFGKRSEVKDSHDRYSNIQINYLLQRMEAYRGVAILATNMKKALDVAFLRRLRFVVDFPFPTAAQRLLIWKRAFPTAGRKGDLPHVPLGDARLQQALDPRPDGRQYRERRAECLVPGGKSGHGARDAGRPGRRARRIREARTADLRVRFRLEAAGGGEIMKYSIQIDRLVLDGLPVSRAQGPLVQAAVESELSRLFTEGSLSPELLSGGALAGIPAASMPMPSGETPAVLGERIARAVYGGLGT